MRGRNLLVVVLIALFAFGGTFSSCTYRSGDDDDDHHVPPPSGGTTVPRER